MVKKVHFFCHHLEKQLSKHLTDKNIDINLFDQGKASIGGNTTYPFSSAESNEFMFMEEVLSFPVNGVIIVIDNQKGVTDLKIMSFIDKKSVLQIIFTNKQDLNSSSFNIDLDVLLFPQLLLMAVE